MCKSNAITKAIPLYRNQFREFCYKCSICKMEYEFEHEKPYVVSGRLCKLENKGNHVKTLHKHKNSIRIQHTHICPYCACVLGKWSLI